MIAAIVVLALLVALVPLRNDRQRYCAIPGLMLILFLIAYCAHQPGLFAVSSIWVAHIGFDRLPGYGLKPPTAFKDTHLRRL